MGDDVLKCPATAVDEDVVAMGTSRVELGPGNTGPAGDDASPHRYAGLDDHAKVTTALPARPRTRIAE
jgi:hypothetical protein